MRTLWREQTKRSCVASDLSRMLVLLVLCAGLGLVVGCPPAPPPTDTLGVLKTNVPNQLLVFTGAKRGVPVTQRFLLFNAGRIPIRLDTMEIRGDSFSIFRVQPRLDKAVMLAPGEVNGIGFEVEFHPDSAGKFRASLVFSSPNVENVDDDGNFLVHLYGQVVSDGGGGAGLRFSCEGGLDFGRHTGPNSADKSCELHNDSPQSIEISDVNYIQSAGTKEDFRWLAPLLPTQIAAGESITVTIRFSPGSARSEGSFELITDPAPPDGAVRLQVKGSTLP